LLAYAQSNALRWIDDPSNAEHGPDRNFLRHQVLPLLQQRWPQASAALARSAELLSEDAQCLRAEAGNRLLGVQTADRATVSVSALLTQPTPWRARLLRLWVEQQGLPPLRGSAIAVIESQLLHARADAQPQYRWHRARMQRWRDLLHVGNAHPPLSSDWQVQWNTRAPLPLPDGSSLQLDMPFDSTLWVRARRGGERIRLPGREHHHSLRHVLQQQAVPPWNANTCHCCLPATANCWPLASASFQRAGRHGKIKAVRGCVGVARPSPDDACIPESNTIKRAAPALDTPPPSDRPSAT